MASPACQGPSGAQRDTPAARAAATTVARRYATTPCEVGPAWEVRGRDRQSGADWVRAERRSWVRPALPPATPARSCACGVAVCRHAGVRSRVQPPREECHEGDAVDGHAIPLFFDAAHRIHMRSFSLLWSGLPHVKLGPSTLCLSFNKVSQEMKSHLDSRGETHDASFFGQNPVSRKRTQTSP